MKQQGFTLVEISIVLVIVSLLLAAILNNQGLIGSTNAKNVIAIVDDLRTATTYFRQRYNYLPGDWPYTTNEIPNISAASAPGDGNGSIGVTDDINAQGQAKTGSEPEAAPLQLYNAGFLGKINSNSITTSFGIVYLASAEIAAQLVAGFKTENPAARNTIIFYNLPCDIASEVDNKIDNGDTASGRAMGTGCVNNIVQWYAVVL